LVSFDFPRSSSRAIRGVFSQCIDCDDIITNPVCSECLATQMKVMISEYDENLAQDIVVCDVEGATLCMHCTKPMGLCAHCFSRDVYEQISQKNGDLADEFMARFDFNLRESFV
jgi:hypothetical protein